jgi:hypothetical protein
LIVLRGGGTWVGLRSRAEGVPMAGGICVGFERHLSLVNDSSLLQSLRAEPYKADVGATVGFGARREQASHIGHVRVAALSDVCRYRRAL